MAVVGVLNRGDHFFFDERGIDEAGLTFRTAYQSAKPFPHVVLDDFLPVAFAERLSEHFPDKQLASVHRTDATQYLKRGFRPDDLGDSPARSYVYAFNSRPVVRFLEGVTGIEGLVPDPYYQGAGFHEIDPGGRLAVHADFTLHQKLNLVRRVNLLVYLNKDWEDAYGGSLELWDAEMHRCERAIAPIFNRCVIFNTDRTSFHGHPDPLACPEHRTRRSLALYYYTARSLEAADDQSQTTGTDWRARPGMRDELKSKRRYALWRRLFPRS